MKTRSLSIFLALSLALLSSSCKNEASTDGVSASQQSSATVPSRSDSSAQASGAQSAERWNGKLNELLTLEMASSVSGHPSSEVKEKYNQVLKNQASHSMRYAWKKGREGVISNPVTKAEMVVPVDDSVEISWVRDTTLETFKSNYRTPTEQELADASAAVDKKLGEMQAQGRATEEQVGAAKGVAGKLGSGLSFDDVAGVGDHAVWNNKAKELKVFYQGLEFQIRVDVSPDEAVNRQKSVEVAQKIIDEKLKP